MYIVGNIHSQKNCLPMYLAHKASFLSELLVIIFCIVYQKLDLLINI